MADDDARPAVTSFTYFINAQGKHEDTIAVCKNGWPIAQEELAPGQKFYEACLAHIASHPERDAANTNIFKTDLEVYQGYADGPPDLVVLRENSTECTRPIERFNGNLSILLDNPVIVNQIPSFELEIDGKKIQAAGLTSDINDICADFLDYTLGDLPSPATPEGEQPPAIPKGRGEE